MAKLALRDGGSLDTTPDSGNAGDIEINATDSVSLVGRKDSLRSVIVADVSEDGNAGHIRISAPRLELSDSGISASAGGEGGTGGTIELEVENLFLSDGATIGTTNVIARMGGQILINAKDSVVISGRNPANPSNINSATRGEGDAGRVFVKAGRLTLRDGGTISTRNERGSGNAGEIRLEVDNLLVEDGGSVESTTRDKGNAGAITVNAPEGEVAVTGVGSGITAASLVTDQNAGNAGSAGSIMIKAGRFMVSGGGEVSASTSTSGAGGNVAIESPDIRLSSGGTISARTRGSGKGGNIEINEINGKSGTVLLSGPSTAITSETTADGDAGSVAIRAGKLTICDGAAISASTLGNGKGGSINISASDIDLMNGAKILAQSESPNPNAVSGNVMARADDTFRIFDKSSVSVETEEANAGNIDLKAGFLLRLRDQSSITTSVAPGPAL
ncbi:MAG: hypothetical protein ACREYE_12550 [Gammaproteobacteria bacterium]